jgi:flagellar hook-associated protein 2
MASISSLGIGSGLDLGNLVNSLIDAERVPVENSIARQQNRLTTELSGLGIFRGAVSSFKSSLSGLADPANYSNRSFTNSNPTAVSASVEDDAAVGSYNIDVTNLAENHSLASAAFTSTSDIVGEGTIQIRFGTITGPGFTSFAADPESTIANLTIDSSNNTLSGLRDYINEGDFGVTASIINDGSGYRLTLQSDTSGANAAMEITVSDTGDGNHTDNLGLSRLAFNASATQMTETQAAEDAALSVNGIPVTSSSNTLTEMIEGVSLTLRQETAGEKLNFSVTEDTTVIASSIRKVVSGYNDMMTALNDLGQAGPEGSEAGILVGDSTLRAFISSVRSQMTGTVDGLNGSITALSTIGIRTAGDGSLSIDENAFGAALAGNPEDALALFAPVGRLTDDQMSFAGYSDNSVAGNYAVNITQLATRSSLSGATGLNPAITIGAGNDNLEMIIDGFSTGQLALTHGNYTTGADLATELQLQINSVQTLQDAGVSVSVSYNTTTNGFEITSNKYGSQSGVEIQAVDTTTAADLGLSTGSAAAGLDVAGTIGGASATGDGQTLTSDSGDALGLAVVVSGGTLGERGGLRFTRGLIEQLDSFLDGYLDSDGILSAREDGITESLEGLTDEREQLNLRLESLEARLVAQFSALDALVANFQSTSNFLAQQINNLPGSGTLLNNDN